MRVGRQFVHGCVVDVDNSCDELEVDVRGIGVGTTFDIVVTGVLTPVPLVRDGARGGGGLLLLRRLLAAADLLRALPGAVAAIGVPLSLGRFAAALAASDAALA